MRSAYPVPLRLCALLLAAIPLIASAQENRIGVAAATNSNRQNSNVTGEPPAGEKRIVEVGTNMLANERIVTSANGQAQFLFNDGSSFSVGPDSDLTLDKFVYDPDKGTGEMSLSVTKGVLRFVGGRISKNNPVEVKAGTATMGIRGGIATFSFNPGQTATAKFLFGKEMTLSANGVTQITTRPGTAIDVPPGQPPQPPRTVTPQEMRQTMSAMEAKPAGAGDAGGGSGGSSAGSSGGGSQATAPASGTAGSGGGSESGAPAAPPPAQIESKLDTSGVASANSGGGGVSVPVVSPVAASSAAAPAPTPVAAVEQAATSSASAATTNAVTQLLSAPASVPVTRSFPEVRSRTFLQGGGVEPYDVATFNGFRDFSATLNASASRPGIGLTTVTVGGTQTLSLDLSGEGRAAATLPVGGIAHPLGNGGFFSVLSPISLAAAASIPPPVTNGLTGIKYEGYFFDNLAFFDSASVQSDVRFNTPFNAINGSTPGTNFDDTYSVRFFGFFRPNTNGSYTFLTASDDSSLLWLGNANETVASLEARRDFTLGGGMVVNNAGLHGVRAAQGTTAALEAGTYYPLLIYFGENGGGDQITVNFAPQGGSFVNNGSGFYFSSPAGASPVPVVFDGAQLTGFGYRGSKPADFLFYSLSGLLPGASSIGDIVRFTHFAGTPTPASALPATGYATHRAFGQFGLFSVPFAGDALASDASFHASSVLSRFGGQMDPRAFQSDAVRSVLLQSSLGILGQGAGQSSLFTGMTGIYAIEQAAGTPVISGQVRGTARELGDGRVVAMASNTAAADAGGGVSAVFGADAQYLVFTTDKVTLDTGNGAASRSTGALLYQDMATGAETSQFSITAATRVTTPASVVVATRTTRTLDGYASGLMETRLGNGTLVAQDEGISATISIATEAASNRVVAQIQGTANSNSLNLAFGSLAGNANNSAFINDDLFGATELPNSGAVNSSTVGLKAFMVSHAVAPIDPAVFAPEGAAFCDCGFLQWGWWSANLGETAGAAQRRTHLATWIAGTLPALTDVPLTGTASYSGHVIGNVNNDGIRYVAMGSYAKTWDFSTRSGTATISNFDSRTVNFATTSGNGRDFIGTLASGSSASVTAAGMAGSFYRSASDPVAGVGGQFAITGSGNYQANGTFAAKR